MSNAASPGTFAVLGLYTDARKIIDAAKQIRPRKLGRLEAYTPYPVHGLDKAVGLPPSPLGKLVLGMGILGAVLALLLEWWTSAVDYPLITGGKALFSWQAFIPVMFEVTVLFATFTAGLAMLFAFNKLPFFGHPVLHSKAIKGITRDKLALSIESAGATFDAEAARQALLDNGADSVEIVPIPAWDKPLSLVGLLRTIAAITAACVVSGAGLYVAEKMIFGDITTGPSSDLSVATNLARAMVTRWGMSDLIGPVALDDGGGRPEFMGGVEKEYSESISSKVDGEVSRIMNDGIKSAETVLTGHKKALDAIAHKLIEVETLEREDFEKILIANGITPKAKEVEQVA